MSESTTNTFLFQGASGRDVVLFISKQHVGPDMEVELFLLNPSQGDSIPARV